MTRDDTLSMLSLLKAAYPSFYAKMTAKDANGVIELWSEMFADEDVNVVKVALKTLIETHSGFPPDIADVKSEIKRIVGAATGAKTDAELWQELADAVMYHTHVAYECNEIFFKLDPLIRSYVGSPSGLRDMGKVDHKDFTTVSRALFMKAIPSLRQREEYSKALPEGVRQYIQRITKKIDEPEMLPDENATRNAVLDALEAASARGG